MDREAAGTRRVISAALPLCVLMVAASASTVEAFMKCLLPNGQTYFGDTAPPGCTSEEKFDLPSGSPDPNEPPPADFAPSTQTGAASDGARIIEERKRQRAELERKKRAAANKKGAISLLGARLATDGSKPTMRGSVKNTTEVRMTNVRVCVNGESPCYSTSPSTLDPGEEADFSFEIPSVGPRWRMIPRGDPD